MPWAEFWYNTTYHSVIDKILFEVVYGRPPPLLTIYEKRTTINQAVEQELLDKYKVLAKVKKELEKVQNRMKKYHDQGRHAVTFQVRDYVYLKLQPTKQKTLCKNKGVKLN